MPDPTHASNTRHLYLIAGEASGDALGAKLMRALKAESRVALQFHGVGGAQMQAEGLQPLFPMEELSLLGFLEILPHIPHLLNRIRQTAEHIRQLQPEAVITIDAPAFTGRVVQQIQELMIPKIHYVAPSVWAYKPKRAARLAQLYDHLLCLLPFEPPYFEQEGLPATFIGHPIVENALKGNADAFFAAHPEVPTTQPLLLLTPGSRSGELQRHLPVYRHTLEQLQHQGRAVTPVMLATPRFAERLAQETAGWPVRPVVVSGAQEKADAMAACAQTRGVALAKSGTGTLELAMAGVPMVVAYRVHPISAWLLRRMIKVDTVTLVNLIAQQKVVPEYLQERCAPQHLVPALTELLESEENQALQRDAFTAALTAVGQGLPYTPSQKAATTILGLL